MRLNYRLKEAWKFLLFAFYPPITLIACVAFSAIVIVVLGIVMYCISECSIWYDFVVALTTGAVASFFVSFVVELTSNYRHNKQALYELQDYYSAVADYEDYKQIMMQLTPHQRAERKAHEEFIAAGGIEELDEDDEPKDIIQITWEQLPTLMPILKNAYEDKKEFLEDSEVFELNNILWQYKEIRSAIQRRVMMTPMLYDALNHPDEAHLKLQYPEDVINNMPEWVRKHLASQESQKALDKYVDTILADGFMLSQVMSNYDISKQGIDNYQNEIDELEEKEYESEIEDIDYDELDFSDPEDEETFRAQNEAFSEQLEMEERPLESWHISSCCLRIAKSLDILEKCIMKKPYYGMRVKESRNSAKRPTDDVISTVVYESEKKQLDKKLKKQRNSNNDGD